MLSVDANALAIFLVVLCLVFLLTKVFFNPVRKIVRDRDKLIKGNKEASQDASESFERGLQEIETRLKSARNAAKARRNELEAEAQKQKSQMIAEIQEEYKAQVTKARAEMSVKIEELKRELESRAEALAEGIEQKILP